MLFQFSLFSLLIYACCRLKLDAIVDDLLATGGTVNCVANLLKRKEKEILGLLTVVELVALKGRSKFNFPVESSISF